MKRINEYKKLFNIDQEIDLKELKTTYRNLVKEWHPDKFTNPEDHAIAEVKSRQIIDGYHFLVSISPETMAANEHEYRTITTESGIVDFKHKGQTLEITFYDGTTYEYFGVTKNMLTKFINADKQLRFAKRNILTSYLYRKSKKGVQQLN